MRVIGSVRWGCFCVCSVIRCGCWMWSGWMGMRGRGAGRDGCWRGSAR